MYTVSYCKNTTENGNWCKSLDETDLWLKKRTHGIIYQETRVNANIWADSSQKENELNYFPITTKTSEFNLRPIEVDASKRDQGVLHDIVHLSKNKVTIDDSIIWPNPR